MRVAHATEVRATMQRLRGVVEAISRSLAVDAIGTIVVDSSADILGATNGALWIPSGADLILVSSRGYDDATRARYARVSLDAPVAIAKAARERMAVEVRSREDLRAQFPGFTPPREGELAFVCEPLIAEDRMLGVAVFGFDHSRAFDTDDRAVVDLIVHVAAHALDRARLLAHAEDEQRRARFLAQASAALAESLDFETTLRTVARLAVPSIGDWCAVEILDQDGKSRQLAVAHVDPEKVALAEELRRRYPPEPDAPTGVPAVLKSGKAELYPDIPDELLVKSTRDAEHLQIAREIGMRSALIVPMRAHGRVLGAITFVTAGERANRYGEADLAMAQDLADRAALAVANANLYSAERRAVQLRDEFLSIASHELKTPLTALRLQAAQLRRAIGSGDVAKVAERAPKIDATVGRLVRLVEELLDVSRITSDRLRLDREEVDLAEIVRDVVARLQESATRAGSTLCMQLDGRVIGYWDRLRVDHVVTNLVANAIKYGEGRPIEITITTTDDRALLTVRDHGIGISPEDQRRIFERFERAVSVRSFGGFGLGLWIVRQVIEAHGGSVTVESQLGAGATFRVELPRRPPPA